MTGGEVSGVAVYAVVNSCGAAAGVVVHVALRGPAELSGPSRRRTLPAPYRSFILATARSTFCPWLVALLLLLLFTADDDGFWNIGRRGVFTMLAQLSLIAGDRPSREATSPSRREERKAGLEKIVLCGRDDLVSTVISVGELSRCVSWPSELTPAHVPRSPAPLEARAGAGML